ncbi:MAG: hypothetical protein J0H49_31235 [Acidobacteria bacterium]|nr:hypothetical protein [Acidobacteriota bacterium]
MKLQIRVLLEDDPATEVIAPDANAWPESLPDEGPQFAMLPSASRIRPMALFASVGLHVIGIVLLREALIWASAPQVDVVRDLLARSRVERLVLKVSTREPLLLPRIRSQAIAAKPGAPAAGGSIPQSDVAAMQPRAPETPQATAILIQPKQQPLQSEPPQDLRSVAVWSGQTPEKVRAPITAGSVATIPAVISAKLATPPEVAIPAPPQREIPAPPVKFDHAGLALPVSGSPPISSEDPPAPSGGAAPGEQAAIISIAAKQPKPDESFEIPVGNLFRMVSNLEPARLAAAPAQPAGHGKAEPGKPSNLAGKTAGRRVDPSAGAPRQGSGGAANPSSQPSGAGTLARTPPGAVPGKGPGSEQGAGAAEGRQIEQDRDIRSRLGTIKVKGNSDGTVTLTYPHDGQFDIVIVQSDPSEELGDLSGLLSGKPIRTVFIQVGAAKEWILEYCLPEKNQTGVQQQGMVVSLGSPPPLKAPYLLEAQLPPNSAWRAKTHQVFHGVINRTGRWEALRAVTTGDGPARLVEYLSRWIFRPAASGNETKPVEVLLIIPPDPAG